MQIPRADSDVCSFSFSGYSCEPEAPSNLSTRKGLHPKPPRRACMHSPTGPETLAETTMEAPSPVQQSLEEGSSATGVPTDASGASKANGGWAEVWRLAMPLILSNSVWTLQITIDRVMLAQWDSNAVAAAMPGVMLFM